MPNHRSRLTLEPVSSDQAKASTLGAAATIRLHCAGTATRQASSVKELRLLDTAATERQLLIAAIGPASWLAVIYFAGAPGSPRLANLPQPAKEVLGLLIAFGAIPRMVFGPVLLVIEGATFLLVRQRVTRVLLAAAMLMDLVPLSLFALHLARAVRY